MVVGKRAEHAVGPLKAVRLGRSVIGDDEVIALDFFTRGADGLVMEGLDFRVRKSGLSEEGEPSTRPMARARPSPEAIKIVTANKTG